MQTKEKVVQEIPILYRANMTSITEKENVTYYARVSTDLDEQEDSYELQKEYFEELIRSNPKWNYVEGYADYGKTGLFPYKESCLCRQNYPAEVTG